MSDKVDLIVKNGTVVTSDATVKADLAIADKRWQGHAVHLITGRYPATHFADAFAKPAADEIKAVVEWMS